jgi:toxin ParE1/3/4
MSICVIAPKASRDLNAISDYFVEKNIEAGERLLKEFEQKCQNLIKFPKMGKSYSKIRTNLRGVPLGGYIIFYQIIPDGIEVLRVVNGRKDLEALFDDQA